MAMGGEWGGAALLAIEHAPADRRAFFGSFAQLGSSVGATLSAAVFAVSEHIGGGLAAGSWRIPFLASAVLVVVGLIVRLVVGESPEFARARDAAQLSAAPVREVFRAPRPLLIGIGAMLVATGGYYVTSSFFLSYASEEAGVPVELLLNALIIGGLFEMLFVPFAGWLGDKWQPRYVVVVGLIGIAVISVPLYLLAHTGSFLVITFMLVVTALFTGFNYGPIAAVLAGIFPVRVRYTGTSLAYQGAALTAGALTPIVLPTLLGMSSGSPGLIFAYLAVLCIGAAGCVLVTRQLTVDVEPLEEAVK
ncbi:MFS transporter [Mycolicibacterium setense]